MIQESEHKYIADIPGREMGHFHVPKRQPAKVLVEWMDSMNMEQAIHFLDFLADEYDLYMNDGGQHGYLCGIEGLSDWVKEYFDLEAYPEV